MPSVNKTPNIGLNNWKGNEFPKRQDFVDDNFKIDEEIHNLKTKVENIDTTAEKTTIKDANNYFTSDNVEGALSEIMVKVNATDAEIKGQKTRGVAIANSLLSKV